MKAISINAYEIENDDGETLVFMTPKEFDFIKKQNDLKNEEIERLNNIINELEKYLNEQIQKSWEIEEQCYEDIESKLKELKGSESNE